MHNTIVTKFALINHDQGFINIFIIHKQGLKVVNNAWEVCALQGLWLQIQIIVMIVATSDCYHAREREHKH